MIGLENGFLELRPGSQAVDIDNTDAFMLEFRGTLGHRSTLGVISAADPGDDFTVSQEPVGLLREGRMVRLHHSESVGRDGDEPYGNFLGRHSQNGWGQLFRQMFAVKLEQPLLRGILGRPLACSIRKLLQGYNPVTKPVQLVSATLHLQGLRLRGRQGGAQVENAPFWFDRLLAVWPMVQQHTPTVMVYNVRRLCWNSTGRSFFLTKSCYSRLVVLSGVLESYDVAGGDLLD